ncbi:MAG: DUF2892 domain-containing protein [Eubacteriales bacterium]|nr:DUF2892 domain-containing protein [Eubacteriales bacterium]
MKKNIGTVDKWIRLVLGLALLSMFLWVPGGAKWFGLIGLIPLVTALIGFCPLYALFGINTNKSAKK